VQIGTVLPIEMLRCADGDGGLGRKSDSDVWRAGPQAHMVAVVCIVVVVVTGGGSKKC